MLVTLLLVLWGVMWIAPETEVGRFLNHWLVVVPAARLARVRRETVIMLLVLCLLGLGCAWLIGHDGLQMFGMAAPDLAMLLTSFEVASYIDAVIAVMLAASAVRWSAVRMVIVRRLRRPRAARARRVRRPERRPANDDEGRGALQIAA